MTDDVLVEQRDRILIIRSSSRWTGCGTAGPSAVAGATRGLAQGSIFHRDGTLIATVVQEGLMHANRTPAAGPAAGSGPAPG